MTDKPNSGTVKVPRELLEQAIRRDYPKPRLDGNYCCVSCGRWMPHDHDEPHDHLEGCAEEKAAADAHWPNRLRAILAQPAEPPRTGHAIPQWLRDRFDADELAVMQGKSASATFTSMRTAVQAYFEMQRERSELAPCAKSQVGTQPSAALAIPDECPHMIVFDDNEREPITFAGSGARVAALKSFEKISGSWNAHLFVRIERNSRDDRYPSASAVPDTQAVKFPDVDQLSNIIRQVDGNHSLGAGALAEKIIEAVAGLNDYGRHGDEDMMVEE